MVMDSFPEVLNHNVETVARLQRQVRPQAGFERSLKVIRTVKSGFPGIFGKSGLMLGLGETEREVLETAGDLIEAGCEILTLGQYLPPSEWHHPLVEYLPPEVFERLADKIRSLGMREVYAAPTVRSSYHAAERYQEFERV